MPDGKRLQTQRHILTKTELNVPAANMPLSFRALLLYCLRDGVDESESSPGNFAFTTLNHN